MHFGDVVRKSDLIWSSSSPAGTLVMILIQTSYERLILCYEVTGFKIGNLF